MAKRIPAKKSPRPRVRAKGKIKKKNPQSKHFKGWACLGFDTSLSSLAGAGIAWDETLKKFKGPAFTMRRFEPADDYFSRLDMAVRASEMVEDLMAELRIILPYDEIWIAQEEPFPPHSSFTSRGHSSGMKQQAEISGAFLAGLVRWGYTNIFQIGNQQWRKVVADQISEATGQDITTHHTKWKDPRLAGRFNCKPDDTGKFRAQQWAQDIYEPWSFQDHGGAIPDFPPMIQKTGAGKVPRPENSKAKAFQCDDRYEALAMAEWARLERAALVE